MPRPRAHLVARQGTQLPAAAPAQPPSFPPHRPGRRGTMGNLQSETPPELEPRRGKTKPEAGGSGATTVGGREAPAPGKSGTKKPKLKLSSMGGSSVAPEPGHGDRELGGHTELPPKPAGAEGTSQATTPPAPLSDAQGDPPGPALRGLLKAITAPRSPLEPGAQAPEPSRAPEGVQKVVEQVLRLFCQVTLQPGPPAPLPGLEQELSCLTQAFLDQFQQLSLAERSPSPAPAPEENTAPRAPTPAPQPWQLGPGSLPALEAVPEAGPRAEELRAPSAPACLGLQVDAPEQPATEAPPAAPEPAPAPKGVKEGGGNSSRGRGRAKPRKPPAPKGKAAKKSKGAEAERQGPELPGPGEPEKAPELPMPSPELPTSRWPPFHVGTACTRRCHCKHQARRRLPPNVAAW